MPDILAPQNLLPPASSLSATPARIPSAQSKQITHAAAEFESVLLGQWLGSAEKSFGTVPGADEDQDPGGEQMQSFAMQQLATVLTASGGVGIARIVAQALARSANANTSNAEAQAKQAAGH